MSAAGESVLVVDDDVAILEMIRLVLEGSGHCVATARDGVEALTRLRSDAPKPCLILLDLMMPRMNGWDFRAEQVRDPKLAEIPVCVLTGDRDAAGKAAALGVAGYHDKPIDLDSLLETVARYC